MVRYIAESEHELDEFSTIQEPFPTAYLTLIVEGQMSHSFPLRGEVQLGREKGNAIVVADQKVSRRHASLTPIDNSFIITDQGSANGTYINGVLIAQPTRLKNNDRVSVGDTTFLFTTNPPDSDSLARPLSSFSSPSPARPIASRLAPTTIAGNNTSSWILVGCMVLIIIALLFIVAVLLGLFIGHSQLVGWWVSVTQFLI